MAEEPPPAETPADDLTLVQDAIANYEAATDKIREVAKWFATAGGALAALLVGTSPLAGLGDVSGGRLVWAIISGIVALAALGWLVRSASDVLTPVVMELDAVAQDAAYADFRKKVERYPTSFLGGWAETVPDFLKRRTELYEDDSKLLEQTKDLDLGVVKRGLARESRKRVQLSLRRSGWVAQRLLAAADNDRTWTLFTSARRQAFRAISVCAVAVISFAVAVQSAEPAADSIAVGPVPIRIALTPAGVTALGPLLGASCPTTNLEGVLFEGSQNGPWSVMITDDDCTNGRISLAAEQGTVLIPSVTG